jgi:uncharacterized C2H2 Zn-finger protein
MIFNNIEKVNVKARFKFYPYIICNDKEELWQLPHCTGKRTKEYRKIKYVAKRKAYIINGAYVSKKRMKHERNVRIVDELITI